MNAEEVTAFVKTEIGHRGQSNAHGVDLSTCIVTPERKAYTEHLGKRSANCGSSSRKTQRGGRDTRSCSTTRSLSSVSLQLRRTDLIFSSGSMAHSWRLWSQCRNNSTLSR